MTCLRKIARVSERAADTLRANSNYASNEYSLVAREKAAPGKGRQVMSGHCWSSVTEGLPANLMVRDGG